MPSYKRSNDDSNRGSPTPPLAGKTILVTRPAGQIATLCKKLSQLGAETVLHPVIQIVPPENWGPLDRAISNLTTFDRIVFVSPNGVQYFTRRLNDTDGTVDEFRQQNFACIGSATQESLSRFVSTKTNILPIGSSSKGLADTLIQHSTGQKLLIVRGNRGSQELSERLDQANIVFEEIIAYQSIDIDTANPDVVEKLQSGQIDWVTITSSAIARATIRLFGKHLRAAKTVSISPTTSQAMMKLGWRPDAEASEYNMQGLVNAIVSFQE